MDGGLKPIRWIGTSLRDLRSFPRAVRVDIGHALFTAQEGKTDPAAKPLKGFGGASVFEIVASHRGNAWRAVYTVRFQDAIYVLHVFQKKSTKGIATPVREIELLKAQLTLQIHTILKSSGMTQAEIAKILGVQQPQVSLLMRNRAGNFSVGRLMEFLTALRQDVEITVRPTRKEHGALSVISR